MRGGWFPNHAWSLTRAADSATERVVSGPAMLGMIFFCANTKIIWFYVFAELSCIYH